MRTQQFTRLLFNDRKGHLILIFTFSILAHGLLLLNDGVYWDGWLIYAAKFLDRWDLTQGIYADRGGLPVYTAFHWLMYWFPSFVFGYKLVAFLFILFSSLIIYQISRTVLKNTQISFFIALIALTYPANQASVELIVIPYLLSYFLFWLGCYLLVKDQWGDNPSYLLKVSAVASLVLSFRMYSLLVYFYGFLFFLFLVEWIQTPKKDYLTVLVNFVRNNGIYLVLPVIFWILNLWLFPPKGAYEHSDQFIWGAAMFPLAATYFENALIGQIGASIRNITSPVIGLIVFIGAFVFAKSMRVERTKESSTRKNLPLVLLLGGFLLFLAGLVPYVAVGRSTQLEGWSTRNAILVALPISMMLVGVLSWFAQKEAQANAKKLSRIVVFILAALTLLFTAESVKYYLFWQLRAIKDNSVVSNLRFLQNEVSDTSVLFVYDDIRVGGETKYRPHEYFGMFALAWPDKERIGIDVRYYTFEEYFLTGNDTTDDLLQFWYPHLDPFGCQAELHIELGPVDINPSLFTKYFYYRYIAREYLVDFLTTVTAIEIIPIDSTLATSCKR